MSSRWQPPGPQPQQPWGPQAQQPWSPPGPSQGPPGAYGYGGPPRSTGTNALAIVSLITGIIWIFGLGSLIAVITGVIALNQISKQGQNGRGLAIAGVVLGGLGLLGAVSMIILFAAVGQGVNEVGRALDARANAPVTVHVEAEPRVCYTATLTTGSIFSQPGSGSGSGQTSREACGSSSFPLGTGTGRNVVLSAKFGSQPGPISAYLTVDGVDQPRQSTTAPSGGFITLSP